MWSVGDSLADRGRQTRPADRHRFDVAYNRRRGRFQTFRVDCGDKPIWSEIGCVGLKNGHLGETRRWPSSCESGESFTMAGNGGGGEYL